MQMIMKKILTTALGLALCVGFIQAAEGDVAKEKEGGPGKKGEARRAEVIKKYDKNNDGQLDDTEKAAMSEDLKKTRREAQLKKYDKNGDGKLDDAEKEAMREDMKKRVEERKNKNSTAPAPAAPAAPAKPAAPAEKN
jgi:EF hand